MSTNTLQAAVPSAFARLDELADDINLMYVIQKKDVLELQCSG